MTSAIESEADLQSFDCSRIAIYDDGIDGISKSKYRLFPVKLQGKTRLFDARIRLQSKDCRSATGKKMSRAVWHQWPSVILLFFSRSRVGRVNCWFRTQKFASLRRRSLHAVRSDCISYCNKLLPAPFPDRYLLYGQALWDKTKGTRKRRRNIRRNTESERKKEETSARAITQMR